MATASGDDEDGSDGACSGGASDELARIQAELRLAEETIAGLMAQLDGIGRVEEERQAELGQLQMDHRAALEELRMANLFALGAIEEARQADLGQLQIDHREALAAAEARRRADLEEQLGAHALRVVELEAAHAEELGDARRASDERVAALVQARDEALALLEVAGSRAAEVEERERELATAHEHEIAALNAAREEEAAAWRARLAAVDAAQAEALAEEHRKALVELTAEHAQAIAAERLAFEQMLSALQDDLARKDLRVTEARAADPPDGVEFFSPHAELEETRVERDAELARERAERRRVPTEPPPSPVPPSPLPSATPRAHASIADALLAALSERGDAERRWERRGEPRVIVAAKKRRNRLARGRRQGRRK